MTDTVTVNRALYEALQAFVRAYDGRWDSPSRPESTHNQGDTPCVS